MSDFIVVAAFNFFSSSCSCNTQFSEGNTASSSELRVASAKVEISERFKSFVCKILLSWAT